MRDVVADPVMIDLIGLDLALQFFDSVYQRLSFRCSDKAELLFGALQLERTAFLSHRRPVQLLVPGGQSVCFEFLLDLVR